jgi:hypothetical protein
MFVLFTDPSFVLIGRWGCVFPLPIAPLKFLSLRANQLLLVLRYGMYAIIMPVVMGPALLALIHSEGRAKRSGLITSDGSQPAPRKLSSEDSDADEESKGSHSPVVPAEHREEPKLSAKKRFINIWQEMDTFGLLLLGFGWTLLLLPFSLSVNANDGYKNPSLIAMFAVGAICLISYCIYEALWAKFPTAPIRLLKNRTFVTAVIVSEAASGLS